MLSLNLIFHAFSAICFVAVGLYIVKLRKEALFSRRLWQSLGGKGYVHLDWPLRFLEMFASAVGAEWKMQGKPPKGNPVRIDPSVLLELASKYGVQRLSLNEQGTECSVSLAGKVDNIEDLTDRLTKSLGGECRFKLTGG